MMIVNLEVFSQVKLSNLGHWIIRTVNVYKKEWYYVSNEWVGYISVCDGSMWRGAVCDVVMLGDDMLIDAASYKQVVVLCQVTRLYEVVVVSQIEVVVSQIEVVVVMSEMVLVLYHN